MTKQEDDQRRQKRLQWQSRRGLLELDLLLGDFVARCWSQLDEEEKSKLEVLLSFDDPQLQSWLLRAQVNPSAQANTSGAPPELRALIGKIRVSRAKSS